MGKGFTIPLSVDGLLARSRDITGVDIVDVDVIEPLTVLHKSLNEESRLHEKGAIAKQNKLLRLLSNRLRMQRDYARHPEIAEQKINEPLFVYGMPRSGTTKTQKILAASGDFNWLPFWQSYNPSLYSGSRDEPVQARIADADVYCRWFDAASPQNKLGHPFETHEPEEETTLTEGSFRAPSLVGYAEVPSYLQWLGAQRPASLFEFLRDSLKYLQWQGLASMAKPWLLKAPTYYGLETELLKVFPDAHLVMAHRSPLQTIPSSCKLIEGFRIPFAEAPVDPVALSAGFAMMMNYHLAVRGSLADGKILDLSFGEITRSIDAVTEKIYAHIGMPMSNASRQRMQQWSVNNPMHKNGVFKYSLEEFGLSGEKIKQDMSAYLVLLQTLFG